MRSCWVGHAAHPHWETAVDQVLQQWREAMPWPQDTPLGLGLLYVTDYFSAIAPQVLDRLANEWPGVAQWSGTVGVGVLAHGVEHIDTPAIAVMLCDVSTQACQVFGGATSWGQLRQQGFAVATAMLHADPQTPLLDEMVEELADQTQQGAVFGGLSSSRGDHVQLARTAATPKGEGVYQGGVCGVAWSPSVAMQTRITQGCAPIGVVHTITTAKDNLVLTLNDAPALYALMHTLDVPIDNPRSAVDKVRHTLVGLSAPDQPVLRATGALQDQAIVRHIIGLDPVRHGVALAQAIEPGMQLTFCERNAASAKADLLRVVTEIRDSLEPQGDDLPVAGQRHAAGAAAPVKRIAGAVYISCTGRGGPFFGFAHAELQIIQRALGDIPLVGFMASGEIAHRQLYGYSGVLTVFFADTNQAA